MCYDFCWQVQLVSLASRLVGRVARRWRPRRPILAQMHAARAPAVGRQWFTERAGQRQKNNKVFSSLRKRKNFEIFSTCFDGGDIEAGDGACRERGTSSSAAQRASVPSGLMELERLQRKSACSTAWYAQPSAIHCLRVLACDRSGAPGGFRRRPHSRAQPTAACSMTPPAAHAYAPACTTA